MRLSAKRDVLIMDATKPSTDYSAVRDGGAGLIDLSARGRILISGTESVMFLNGLVTNDMKTLAVNSWMPAVFPNVQGRLLAAVRVIHRNEGFLIDTENATRDTVVKLLERFTLAGDFRLADLTQNTALLSIQGAQAPEIMAAIFGETVANLDKIDPLIAETAEHWRPSRMAALDRLILRLAIGEFLHGETPRNVVINEALELAKTFSGDDSAKFINGILDAVKKKLG